jgi:hypothetical protein
MNFATVSPRGRSLSVRMAAGHAAAGLAQSSRRQVADRRHWRVCSAFGQLLSPLAGTHILFAVQPRRGHDDAATYHALHIFLFLFFFVVALLMTNALYDGLMTHTTLDKLWVRRAFRLVDVRQQSLLAFQIVYFPQFLAGALWSCVTAPVIAVCTLECSEIRRKLVHVITPRNIHILLRFCIHIVWDPRAGEKRRIRGKW